MSEPLYAALDSGISAGFVTDDPSLLWTQSKVVLGTREQWIQRYGDAVTVVLIPPFISVEPSIRFEDAMSHDKIRWSSRPAREG